MSDPEPSPEPAAEPEAERTPPWWKRKFVAVPVWAWLGLAAVIAIGSVGTTQIQSESAAESTCNEVSADGVTVAQGASIFTAALEDGVSIVDLRNECGDMLDAVMNGLGIGSLADGVDVQLSSCGEDIEGTLVNNNTVAIDATITYELLDDNDVRVDDGLVFVDRVAPGQTVKWDSYLFDASFARCRIDVERVTSS